MDKVRMEAFSDAITTIVMTILVLELSIPQTADLNALLSMKEQFLVYVLSFFVLAIYWVNHHYLIHLADRINEQVLWANILCLFAITFVPFDTAWLGRNMDSLIPAMLYGIVYLIITVTYILLQYSLIKCNGENSKIYNTLSGDNRLLITSVLGIISILLAFILPILTPIACFLISAMWIFPTKIIRSCPLVR